MAKDRESGCDILRWPGDTQEIEKAIVKRFAPVLYFAPQERFYPVDLRSTMRASSLWLADPNAQPPTAQQERAAHSINPTVDLLAKTENHFSTVVGFTPPQPPLSMPFPKVDDVHRMYETGTIGAELTIYATICNAGDDPIPSVPNRHLFKDNAPGSKVVAQALQEGLIVNYYMFFPACESPELTSEGDWSGISLLLPARPTQSQDLTDPARLQQFLPVVTAYYHKTIDGAPPSPSYRAANGGFRRWQDVQKAPDQGDGLETHPIVYISGGRHNCYYKPMSGPVSLGFNAWSSYADDVETGNNVPGPANNSLKGGAGPFTSEEVALEIFLPLGFLAAMFHGSAIGCKFDTSGVAPAPYVEGNDATAPDANSWYHAAPAPAGSPGATYPQTGRWPGGSPPSLQLPMKIEYVDLVNDAELAALWRYTGTWGAATKVSATLSSDPQHPKEWGAFRGTRRPALAAWFLWNLFLDCPFGCCGNSTVTPVP